MIEQFFNFKIEIPKVEKIFGLDAGKMSRVANSSKQIVMNEFARVNQRDLKSAVKLTPDVKVGRNGFEINIMQEVLASLAKSKVGTIERKYKYQQERISQLQTKYNSMKSSIYSTHANLDGSLPFMQQAALSRAQAQLSSLQQQNIRLKNKISSKSKLKSSGPMTASDFMQRHPKFMENLARKLETKVFGDVIKMFVNNKTK